MAIDPITDKAGLDIYLEEISSIIAVNAMIEKAYYNLLESGNAEDRQLSELKTCITQRQMYLAAMNDAVTAYHNKNAATRQRWIEQNIVSPFMRGNANFVLGIGFVIKQTVSATALVLSRILLPISLAIDGLKGMWDFYQTWTDKTIGQRRTNLGVLAISVAGSIAAGVVFGLAIVNPIALPLIFTGLSFIGLYQASYALHQTRQAIKNETKAIKSLQDSIERCNQYEPTPLNVAQLANMHHQEKRHQHQLTKLHERGFQQKKGVTINVLATIAVGLFVAGVFFPPLTGLGMILFGSVAIISAIDAKTNSYFSRKIGNAFLKVASIFGSPDREPVTENKPLLAPAGQISSTSAMLASLGRDAELHHHNYLFESARVEYPIRAAPLVSLGDDPGLDSDMDSPEHLPHP